MDVLHNNAKERFGIGNDIKEGEYVVHTIHGVGVYQGLTKQEFDGQLKDYLTIEYANKDNKLEYIVLGCLIGSTFWMLNRTNNKKISDTIKKAR